MTETQTKPLVIKSKLAGNPTGNLRYKLEIQIPGKIALQVADPRATRALISLMDMSAVIGGAASHYGGPAALAELMSALHALVFAESQNQNKNWFELYHVVNDAGHCENGLYALKANYGMAGLNINSLKKFRSIESGLTGHGEVHCFPEGVFLSNGPLGSAFPQSQGLALGDALAGNSRTTVCVISDGACMEGEAKEALAAIPGLAAGGKMAPFVAILSDNNTKLSGRIDKESFSMQPTFESLKALGWKVLTLEQGNDLQKCTETLAQALDLAKSNPRIPVCVHAKTTKGIGTKKTSESSSGGHGFPLKSATELAAFLTEIYNGEKYPEEFNSWIQELIQVEEAKKKSTVKDSGEKIQKGVSAAMIKARREGLPIVSVTSDLPGSTGVAEFRKEFPKDSLDIGVAESNMISAAVGLSKLGFIPVVDTFAQFGVTKGALPLMMSSLSEAPMVCIFSHTGFQDAADGASHQALSYFAMVASIPHVEVHALTCSDEAEALVAQSIQKISNERKAGRVPNTQIFFLGRENFPKNYASNVNYQLGKAQILVDHTASFSKKVLLVAVGSMMPEALKAAETLREQKIGTMVLNPSCLNHLDRDSFVAAIKKCDGNIVTVEDHQLIGGFAQMMTHHLHLMGLQFRVKSLGVCGAFGQSAYNAIDLYRKHRMDSVSIVSSVKSLLGE
ncbi:MAG: transketolase C-terminal domain-containing protein [Bdellovibrionota bacterium]